jgi:hypothetical protein
MGAIGRGCPSRAIPIPDASGLGEQEAGEEGKQEEGDDGELHGGAIGAESEVIWPAQSTGHLPAKRK